MRLLEYGNWIKDCPINLKIKVLRTAHLTNIKYIASPNYTIKNFKHDSSYESIIHYHKIEEALENSLKEFLHYFNKKEIDHTDLYQIRIGNDNVLTANKFHTS